MIREPVDPPKRGRSYLLATLTVLGTGAGLVGWIATGGWLWLPIGFGAGVLIGSILRRRRPPASSRGERFFIHR